MKTEKVGHKTLKIGEILFIGVQALLTLHYERRIYCTTFRKKGIRDPFAVLLVWNDFFSNPDPNPTFQLVSYLYSDPT